MTQTLRVASRGSPLALVQANIVRDALIAADADLEVEITIVRTTGDRITDTPLAQIGDQWLQPIGGGGIGCELRILLYGDICIGDGVRHRSRQFRVTGGILDHDQTRTFDAIDRQVLAQRIDDPLVDGGLRGVGFQAEHDEEVGQGGRLAGSAEPFPARQV